MNTYLIYILCLIIGYLLGSFPSGYLFYKIKTGKDIRKIGLRKNMGTTNVFVNGGIKLGVLTLIFDIAKGFIPVLLAKSLSSNEVIIIATGIMAIIGHVFPLYIGFKGGTGLATSIGALIVIIPEIIFTYIILFLILTPVVKRPSLEAFIFLILTPFYAYILGYSSLIVGICMVMALMYAIVSLNHIKSMLKGNEYKEVMSILRKH